jgi:diadenosine tetraphosphate (Ap4A) HIT family hydrolase
MPDATHSHCPLCARMHSGELLAETSLAVAFADAFPVSPGHALVIPRRHDPEFFALTEGEQQAIWGLVADVRRVIERAQRPDGYNVGINVGEAAGQTVAHAHVHVIPRYQGDRDDPRGGVRWVIPDRAAYWRA